MRSARKRRPCSTSILRCSRAGVLEASYFDGRSTRVRNVGLSAAGEELLVAGEDVDLKLPFSQVKVDERLGRAPRRLRFPDGTFCEVRDLDALDTLLVALGHSDGRIDSWQRHLQPVILACLASAVLIFLGYKLALPWAAARGARNLPPAVGKTLSAQALSALDGKILLPSQIGPRRIQALTAEFRALKLPEGGTPHSSLLFRNSPQLGPNAFTLPDGTIVVLDELVKTMGDDRLVMAVAAHELGHAYGHHGLQLLLQSTAVGAFLTLYIGDISQLLAAAPAAVLQARYSQDLEQQADDYGATLLAGNGMSPALLADALQKLLNAHPGRPHEGYLSSHPATEARMRHLRELARYRSQ